MAAPDAKVAPPTPLADLWREQKDTALAGHLFFSTLDVLRMFGKDSDSVLTSRSRTRDCQLCALCGKWLPRLDAHSHIHSVIARYNSEHYQNTHGDRLPGPPPN